MTAAEQTYMDDLANTLTQYANKISKLELLGSPILYSYRIKLMLLQAYAEIIQEYLNDRLEYENSQVESVMNHINYIADDDLWLILI
jgi:hypothetical protein